MNLNSLLRLPIFSIQSTNDIIRSTIRCLLRFSVFITHVLCPNESINSQDISENVHVVKTTGGEALVRSPNRDDTLHTLLFLTSLFLSQYSTATQSHSRWVLLRHLTQKIVLLHYQTQNPQRESVEYRLRWVQNANFSHWPCTFHFFA